MNCLQRFQFEKSREDPFEYCKDNETVRTKMPKEGSTFKFQVGQYQFKVPMIMYADLKTILEPMEGPKPNLENPYSKEVNNHVPSGLWVRSEFAYGKVKNPIKLYLKGYGLR